MPRIVYLNGTFLPLDQARVSVLDRGFLFGDAVYEVIPAYTRQPFRLHQHLQRLERSLGAIRMSSPLPEDRWHDVLRNLIERNPGENQALYLQVTRGVPDNRDHAIPQDLTATVFAMSNPLPPRAPAIAERGITAITLDEIRWRYCHIKSTNLLANVLLRQTALDREAEEAILVRSSEVTEGAATNVFLVRAGEILTPPKSELLLPGITRDLILELAADADLPHAERPIPERELETADEIWLSSSTREVVPVTRLDGRPVGNGKPGPTWQRMDELFQAYKERLRARRLTENE
jgi:D-alanine transaminase